MTAQIASGTFAFRLGGVVHRIGTPATVFTAHQRIVRFHALLATGALIAALALASRSTVGVVVLHDLVHVTDARIVAELLVQAAVRLFAQPLVAHAVALLTVGVIRCAARLIGAGARRFAK